MGLQNEAIPGIPSSQSLKNDHPKSPSYHPKNHDELLNALDVLSANFAMGPMRPPFQYTLREYLKEMCLSETTSHFKTFIFFDNTGFRGTGYPIFRQNQMSSKIATISCFAGSLTKCHFTKTALFWLFPCHCQNCVVFLCHFGPFCSALQIFASNGCRYSSNSKGNKPCGDPTKPP